jgi:sialic acid synthase SpsE
MGVLNLSYEEFESMTMFEYQTKCQGFAEYQEKTMVQQAWLTGLTVGMAFSASKENPYPSLDEFTQKLKTPEETDEELFELAKEKGIQVPEGM